MGGPENRFISEAFEGNSGEPVKSSEPGLPRNLSPKSWLKSSTPPTFRLVGISFFPDPPFPDFFFFLLLRPLSLCLLLTLSSSLSDEPWEFDFVRSFRTLFT